ncbi:hypothetical protein QWJ26_08810 [Streptomyces sp. CSDS2]|uniref:hypothetical protein n=1 Tax=Streptomyces sp. CSDS2 TaxID=3055051 RepID=UPI0025B06447|nr:hypothetical protein [Streptomyces sp. CSDS2]MDN3259902.1 hypothetical protein [Streptomyces sp. CSDS2]
MNIDNTPLPGRGRRPKELLRSEGATDALEIVKITTATVGGRKNIPVYQVQRPSAPASTPLNRTFDQKNCVLEPAMGQTEVWHPEARPSWYWKLVADSVSTYKVNGTTDLDRLRSAYVALFGTLKTHLGGGGVPVLNEWSERLFKLDRKEIGRIVVLTDAGNFKESMKGEAQRVYNEITGHDFLKKLEAGDMDTVNKLAGYLTKYTDVSDKDLEMFSQYPALSRARNVIVRRTIANGDDTDLVIHKKNTMLAYRHLLAHEFMHAHSAKDGKGLGGENRYGYGADEAVTETCARAVTDILYAFDNHLNVGSEATQGSRDKLTSGVHYVVWSKRGGALQLEGGLRYAPEVCSLVLAQQTLTGPDCNGEPTWVDKFPTDLMKSYFMTGS